MRPLNNRLRRRLLAAERGASIVEYTAVSVIALLLAGLIVAGLTQGRFTLGGAMAAIHQRQISAFGSGTGGTVSLDGSLYPHPKAPQFPAPLLPALALPLLLPPAPPVVAPIPQAPPPGAPRPSAPRPGASSAPAIPTC